jgi:Protein of unknown function (DUF2934)
MYLTPMDLNSSQEKQNYERLRSAYQRAWKNFSTAVDSWQSRYDDADDSSDQAIERIVQAELSYRDHRNKLADYMLSKAGKADDLHHLQFRVKLLAYYFWEQRGRRHGDAEADWYRAETLLNNEYHSAMQ